MRDGKTSRLNIAGPKGDFAAFAKCYQARLVIVSKDEAGREFPLESNRTVLGRGPAGVDHAFNDQSMSRQHAVVEFDDQGFRVRDLGSTNGLIVNETAVEESQVGNGDCFEIGTHRFRLVVVELDQAPDTYVLSTDA